MTPEMRRADVTAITPTPNETVHQAQQKDFNVNPTASQNFWIGIAIGFSLAVAVWPY